MTVDHRLRRLEERAHPPPPVRIACFDHDGRPLNDLAERMTPEDRAAARPFTIAIDRAVAEDDGNGAA